MNLLWTPDNLASVGALRAQTPTGVGMWVEGAGFRVQGLGLRAHEFSWQDAEPDRSLAASELRGNNPKVLINFI